MTIPILTTKRLVLRPQTAADFPAYEALMVSPRSIYMGGPFSRRAAWGMFCSDLAMWPLYGHGALMIDLRATGECAGQVGINHGPLYPEKELGWLLYYGFEGQGFATEAAVTLKQWAFEEPGLQTLVSYVDRDNQDSISVCHRLGGVRDDAAEKQDEEDFVFRYSR